MSNATKQHFIESLQLSLMETAQRQEKLYMRGFITDAERTEEVNDILQKTAGILLSL